MATGIRRLNKGSIGPRGAWGKLLLAGVVIVGAGVFWYGEEASGMGDAGTAYGARTSCSCRYIAGRELSSCKDDFVDGMGPVLLSEDEDEKSVTAYVPFVASNTARYREGFGCVLDSWND